MNGFDYSRYQQFNRVQPQNDSTRNMMSSIQHKNIMDDRRDNRADQNMMSMIGKDQRQQELNRLDRQEKRLSKAEELKIAKESLKQEGMVIGGIFSRVENENDYKMARNFAAGKFTEVYGPELAAYKMKHIPEKYDPKFPKQLVKFYRSVYDDPKDYDKVVTIDKKGKTRVRARRKNEDMDVPVDEKTLKQYEADKKNKLAEKKLASAKKKSETGKYTKGQQIDDVRGYYKALEKSMIDKDGYVIEGKEKDHAQLMQKMTNDLKSVDRGEKPSYLKQPTGPKGEIVGYGMHKDGYKVVRYENGFIAPVDHRRDKKH